MRFLCKWDRNVNKARQYKNIGQNIPRKTADLNGKQISIASVVWFWTEFSNEREQTTENWKNPVIRDVSVRILFILWRKDGNMKTYKTKRPASNTKRASNIFSPFSLSGVSRKIFRNTPLFTLSSLFNYATWWEFARAYARGRENSAPYSTNASSSKRNEREIDSSRFKPSIEMLALRIFNTMQLFSHGLFHPFLLLRFARLFGWKYNGSQRKVIRYFLRWIFLRWLFFA